MPTKTVVTGTLQDAGGNLVTGGRVQFTIGSGAAELQYYRVAGTAVIVPNVVNAVITSAGQVVAEDGFNPLLIWGNDTLSPSNSWYRIKFAPVDGPVQTTDQVLIQGATYNLNTPTFYDITSFVPDQAPIDVERIQANIIPVTTGQYTLGNDTHYYASAYIQQLFANTITSTSIPTVLTFEQFGAIGNDVADDSTAIQAAITSAGTTGFKIVGGAGKIYRTTVPINITGNKCVWIDGVGTSYMFPGRQNPTIAGTYFHFDHTGKGFNCSSTVTIFDTRFSNFGIIRNQPTVTGSPWTPTANDFDIYTDTVSLYIQNVYLQKSTKGVYVTSTSANAVIDIDRLHGEAFQKFVWINFSADICRLNNLHNYVYWASEAVVYTYMLSNLDFIHLGRVDNPMITNCFAIYARAALRCSFSNTGTVSGVPSLVQCVNFQADTCTLGLWVDGANAMTGQFTNFHHQGFVDGVIDLTSQGILVQANSVLLDFSVFGTSRSALSAIQVTGINDELRFSGPTTIIGWDWYAAGLPAVKQTASSSNSIRFADVPLFDVRVGTGPHYSGDIVYVDEWQSYTPAVSSSGGTITTLGTVTGRFKWVGTSVHWKADITITTNGTGSGFILVGLPNTVITASAGSGYIAASGAILSVIMATAGTSAIVGKHDGTYPGADGAHLVVGGVFEAF